MQRNGGGEGVERSPSIVLTHQRHLGVLSPSSSGDWVDDEGSSEDQGTTLGMHNLQ